MEWIVNICIIFSSETAGPIKLNIVWIIKD